MSALGLEASGKSDDSRGRFALLASGESLLLVLEGIPTPLSKVEPAAAPVVPPLLVVGSSGVALFANAHERVHRKVCKCN